MYVCAKIFFAKKTNLAQHDCYIPWTLTLMWTCGQIFQTSNCIEFEASWWPKGLGH